METASIEPPTYRATDGMAEAILSFGPKVMVAATDDHSALMAAFTDSRGLSLGHIIIRFDAQCRPSVDVLELYMGRATNGSSSKAAS